MSRLRQVVIHGLEEKLGHHLMASRPIATLPPAHLFPHPAPAAFLRPNSTPNNRGDAWGWVM